MPKPKPSIDVDEILRQSSFSMVINTLANVRQALADGDSDTATREAQWIQDELVNVSDALRSELTAELRSQIESIDGSEQSTVWQLVFNAPMPPPDDNDLRTALLDGLFQEAVDATPRSRTAALKRLTRRLAQCDPLTQAHYADKCVEAKLCKRREFNDALKWESERDEGDETPDGSRVPDDDTLAIRWVKAHPHTAYGMGEYWRYGAGYWERVEEDEIMAEVAKVIRDAKGEGVRTTSGRIESTTKVGRLMVIRASELWDNNPDILVVGNGTLHIPTLELREHSSKHYSTSGLPYNYSPDATAPTWAAFISQTVPEAHDFLQEFAGYALTVDTSLETALWLYGPPGSGKSTFISGLQSMLDGKSGILGLADIERSRFALSQLPGKTLVVSTEQPAGYMQAAYILNSIISGEPIPVERKFVEAVTIIPCAKIVWAMNELPRVNDAGNGLFRRVKVIRFPPLSTLPDPNIKEIIKTEGAGILNWALIGLKRLRDRGRFAVPTFVENATEHFQKTNDVSATFTSERCKFGSEYSIQSSVLYDAYKRWCEENGHRPRTSTHMADEWERLGYQRYRSAGKTFWRGLDLLDD